MLENQNGMTLKEMLVVILVIVALAMGAIPLFHYFHDLGEQRRSHLMAV